MRGHGPSAIDEYLVRRVIGGLISRGIAFLSNSDVRGLAVGLATEDSHPSPAYVVWAQLCDNYRHWPFINGVLKIS